MGVIGPSLCVGLVTGFFLTGGGFGGTSFGDLGFTFGLSSNSFFRSSSNSPGGLVRVSVFSLCLASLFFSISLLTATTPSGSELVSVSETALV